MLAAVPAPSMSLCVCTMGLGVQRRRVIIKKAICFSKIFTCTVQINIALKASLDLGMWKVGDKEFGPF